MTIDPIPYSLRRHLLAALPLALLITTGFLTIQEATQRLAREPQLEVASYIIRGRDAVALSRLVEAIGGNVTHELVIIRSVAADLTLDQVQRLERLTNIERIYRNRRARVAGTSSNEGGTRSTIGSTPESSDEGRLV